MAMPWTRAKAQAAAIRADTTGAELERLNELFNACFRIQREACEAAGRHIPMVVENVRGAIPWVGRSAWNFGSFHIWGDVPALMPIAKAVKHPGHSLAKNGLKFGPDNLAIELEGRKVPGFRFDGSGRSFQTASVAASREEAAPGQVYENGLKHGGDWFSDPSSPSSPSRQGGQVRKKVAVAEGRKGAGAEWFDQNLCQVSSNSTARKAASAKIAKIPLPLSRWIGRAWHPDSAPR